MIKIKRVYESFDKNDGFRILVDRLWPRGLTKGRAKIDLWLKEIAPSDQLRKWFGHDLTKWEEFNTRYFQELSGNAGLVKTLKDKIKKEKVTLVYGAEDTKHNNAVVLREYLSKSNSKRFNTFLSRTQI